MNTIKSVLRWVAVIILGLFGVMSLADMPYLVWLNTLAGLSGDENKDLSWVPVFIKLLVVGACWAGVTRLTHNLTIPWRFVGLGLAVLAVPCALVSMNARHFWNAGAWVVICAYGLVLLALDKPLLWRDQGIEAASR